LIVSLLIVSIGVLAMACGGNDDGDGEANDDSDTPAAMTATAPAESTSAAGGDPTTAPAAELNACELVSAADIEAAIGAPVGEGEPGQAANLFTCSYADPAFPTVSAAAVAVLAANNADDAREIYDLAKSNAAEVQEIDGVGEAAYWDDVLNSMQVVEGSYELSIDVASEEGRDEVAVATTIAQKALAALP
jgi:hypothetical protein